MNDEIVQLGDPEGNDGLYTIKIIFIYAEHFEKLILSQKSPPKDLQWMIEFEACGTLFGFKFCLEGDNVKRTYLSHTATIPMWANEEEFNSLRETELKINVKLGEEEEIVGTGRMPLELYTANDDSEIGGSIQIESNQGKLFSEESTPALHIIVEVQRSHIIILENLDPVDGAEKETISRLSDQLTEAKEKLEGFMEENRSLKEDLNEKNSLIEKREEAWKQKEAFFQEILATRKTESKGDLGNLIATVADIQQKLEVKEALVVSLQEEVENLNRTQKELSKQAKQADSRILDGEKRITLLENSIEIFQQSKTEMEKFSSKLNNLEAENQRLGTDLATVVDEIGHVRAELNLKAREFASLNHSTYKTRAAGTKRNSATLPETKATKMTRQVRLRPYSQSHKPSRPRDQEDDLGLETSTESSSSSNSYSPPSPEAIKPLSQFNLPESLFSDDSLSSLEDQPFGTNQNKAKSEVLFYIPPARRDGPKTY